MLGRSVPVQLEAMISRTCVWPLRRQGGPVWGRKDEKEQGKQDRTGLADTLYICINRVFEQKLVVAAPQWE